MITIQDPDLFDKWWRHHRETNLIIRLDGIESIVKHYNKWLRETNNQSH